jgi:hypothetical protein
MVSETSSPQPRLDVQLAPLHYAQKQAAGGSLAIRGDLLSARSRHGLVRQSGGPDRWVEAPFRTAIELGDVLREAILRIGVLRIDGRDLHLPAVSRRSTSCIAAISRSRCLELKVVSSDRASSSERLSRPARSRRPAAVRRATRTRRPSAPAATLARLAASSERSGWLRYPESI